MNALRPGWSGVVAMVAVLVAGAGTAPAAPGLWPAGKGEVCLENTTTGGFARLAVVRVLGTHYSVQGFAVDPGGDVTLLSGSAELAGGQVLMHLTGSGYTAPEVHGLIGTAQLDAGTLEGVFHGLGFHCDPADEPDCGIEAEGPQALAPAACPE
jgi:hypothetical protein